MKLLYLQIVKSILVLFYNSGISSFSDELIEEINKYDLTTYYETHLEKRTKFLKKLPPDVIMRWSSDSLTKPLTKIPSNLVDFSIQLYKSKYN